MLTKEEITGVLRENLAYLASEYGVERIGLCGSYAKDMPTESSDVDIVVEFARPIGFRFAEFAEFNFFNFFQIFLLTNPKGCL